MVQIHGTQDLTGGPFCAKHGETDHRRPILEVLGRNVPCRRCFTIWDHQYQSVPEQYPISGWGPHLGPHFDPFWALLVPPGQYLSRGGIGLGAILGLRPHQRPPESDPVWDPILTRFDGSEMVPRGRLDPQLATYGVGTHRRTSTNFDLFGQNHGFWVSRFGPPQIRGRPLRARTPKWGDLGTPKLTPILGTCFWVPFRLLSA